ncbi:MAG: serine hydrolase, partial [Ruminococcus sp.]|nr:serine hydrolase [Ruminococcus sp.]
MPKNLKALVCLPMAALMLLCGCHPETSSQIEETVVTTEEPTTVEPTTKPVATADSANVKKYDFLAIKQKNGEITSDFNDIVSAKKFKGVIYAKLGNDFEYISSTGASDNAKHKYNSINTCFYVGGLTQQVTAAAVLLLAEDDKLSLNDTIDAYFPDYAYGADITVQNLLDMTSGIKSYILRTDISDMAAYPAIDLGDKLSKDNSYEENKSAVLDWIFRQELDFEPSEAFAISDSNYYLLGEIIAKASGESYESYVKSHLFKPLAMNNTGFEENDRLAAPFDEGAETDKLTFAGVGYSACGMISNMSDILRWSDGIFT